MTLRICAALCLAAAISVTMAAQSEPVLVSANIPKHPPLACQARIEGSVKLTFALTANAAEPTEVEVVSGHQLLKGAAAENVKTWRFDNPYAVQRKYETTFKYQLSGLQVLGTKKLRSLLLILSVMWKSSPIAREPPSMPTEHRLLQNRHYTNYSAASGWQSAHQECVFFSTTL